MIRFRSVVRCVVHFKIRLAVVPFIADRHIENHSGDIAFNAFVRFPGIAVIAVSGRTGIGAAAFVKIKVSAGGVNLHIAGPEVMQICLRVLCLFRNHRAILPIRARGSNRPFAPRSPV